MHRGWRLLAAHVRTNHIHIVVHADRDPDDLLDDYKAYGTRRLKEAGFDRERRKRWTTKGSRPYLWREAQVVAAIRYVILEQGELMEYYLAPEYAYLLEAPSAPRASEPDA